MGCELTGVCSSIEGKFQFSKELKKKLGFWELGIEEIRVYRSGRGNI